MSMYNDTECGAEGNPARCEYNSQTVASFARKFPRAFGRGELRSKGGGKKAIHFNKNDENIELLLRTVISANQLSVYGAVADLCNELSEDFRALWKPEALDYLDTTEIPSGRSTAETHGNAQELKTWCNNTSENSNNCPKTRPVVWQILRRARLYL